MNKFEERGQSLPLGIFISSMISVAEKKVKTSEFF
jgi:hypothetical protein